MERDGAAPVRTYKRFTEGSETKVHGERKAAGRDHSTVRFASSYGKREVLGLGAGFESQDSQEP
jgi:hypothetical protein